MLGTTLLGQRVLDLVGLVDALADHPAVDARRIGIFGISGGATASLMAAILEERIEAAVLSGYVSSFRESVLGMHHCVCNLVPGLVLDLEMADLASALAPRPLLLEAGRRDPIFPLPAVEAAAAAIGRSYRELGVPERFVLDAFEGEHEVSGRAAIPFLARWLALEPAGDR
jgi:dienelactone hydrolase